MNRELSIWRYFDKCVAQNYANFEGRARRRELWSYQLVYCLLYLAVYIPSLVLIIMTEVSAFAFIPYTLGIALFLPTLAVWVRRLHDIGRSGWWYLILLIPLIGGFILLYWAIKEGDPGPNQYGEDPKSLA